jgi:hypothetical protein
MAEPDDRIAHSPVSIATTSRPLSQLHGFSVGREPKGVLLRTR